MKWLVLAWAISYGYIPEQSDFIMQHGDAVGAVLVEPAYSLNVETEALLFKHFRLYGNVKSYQAYAYALYFTPYRIDYGFGAALVLGPIEIGMRHECDHGVESQMDFVPWYGSNETEIYFTVRGKVAY